MIHQRSNQSSEYICSVCGKQIIGVAWGNAEGVYCSSECLKKSREKGENMARKKRATTKGFKAVKPEPGPEAEVEAEVEETEPEVEPEAEAEAEAKPTTSPKPKKPLGVGKVDGLKIPSDKLPKRSPFKDAHQAKCYREFIKCKTVDEFRQVVKKKGLYKNNAPFFLVLYGMASRANRGEDPITSSMRKRYGIK